MDYAAAIKQQAEDLQDELKDLALWQEEVARQHEVNKMKKSATFVTNSVPPIRGTVPSLKEAVLKSAGVVEKEDPVKKQKDKGNELFQSGKLQEAVEAYAVGIDLDPEGPMAHVLYGNRALCYLKLERWSDAERDASSCVRLNRTYAKGYFRRATARKQLGNLKGARTDLEAVLALSPNDVSATNEMSLVTKMIRADRDGAEPVTRKKIVITEVDDDDDEQCVGEGARDKTASPSVIESNTGRHPNTVGDQVVKNEIAELERFRAAQRDAQEARSRERETKLQYKGHTSSRVEIVEEINNESKEGVVVSSSPLSLNNGVTSASAQECPSRELAAVSTSGAAQRPATFKDKKMNEPVVPRMLKPTVKWTKDTLKAPKSFTEFERVFLDLKDDEELLCFYVSVIPPGSMQVLFGSNMTPDILLGMLKAAGRLSGTSTVSFLKGLCTVKRVRDISLFFDDCEKKVVEEVMDVVVSCGASDEDVSLFRRQLGVI
ncbi:TPR-repeat protein, putative [Trypanosoma brucei gambiense DAL972]|uniref:RNA polymerase II-associated protein 3 n=1 Tax=Trypanosoma brucei gambiense (strain MHOM/CI/86/DAL972) TaxID=679716 RepID=C9ZJL2_TRYB9|nr:TPR-repeat protein, putative [Trypanosoma brucei gambiense DAL972]CBH09571.1 TPR-repeat protein, putative [Trypanosoma brucei gambiense DAL972]|eukprot:XP_011771876.1 TPR-repeat protein, putative [Trypanosoma brucei gambiense DAL972]